MLYASLPLTVVHAAVCPNHLTLSMSLFVMILAPVNVPACPREDALALPLVFKVFSFVNIAFMGGGASPLASPVFQATLEFTNVDLSLRPLILACTMGLAVIVLACVCITACKAVGSCPLLQAEMPLALIAVPVWPGMQTVTMCSGSVPLSSIRVSTDALPDTVSMLEPTVPFAVVDFSIRPCVHSVPVRFASLELTVVGIAIGIALKTFTVTQIVEPASLVLAAILVFHRSEAMSLLFLVKLTYVNGLRVSPCGKARC